MRTLHIRVVGESIKLIVMIFFCKNYACINAIGVVCAIGPSFRLRVDVGAASANRGSLDRLDVGVVPPLLSWRSTQRRQRGDPVNRLPAQARFLR
jgi:hypothetical protein